MKQEEELREQMSKAKADEVAAMQQQMARLQQERKEQDEEIERVRRERERLQQLQVETTAKEEANKAKEAQIEELKQKIEQMSRTKEAADAEGPSNETLRGQLVAGVGIYDTAETMVHKAEARMARQQPCPPRSCRRN